MVQAPAFTPLHSRVARALSLCLVLVVGLQGLPLQSLVHGLQQTPTHEECTHPHDFCPMTASGECTCAHADAKAPDEPTFRPCDGTETNAVSPVATGKWLFVTVSVLPSPRLQTHTRPPKVAFLTSQRTGTDVFRPPRRPTHLRSGSTLPTALSA